MCLGVGRPWYLLWVEWENFFPSVLGIEPRALTLRYVSSPLKFFFILRQNAKLPRLASNSCLSLSGWWDTSCSTMPSWNRKFKKELWSDVYFLDAVVVGLCWDVHIRDVARLFGNICQDEDMPLCLYRKCVQFWHPSENYQSVSLAVSALS